MSHPLQSTFTPILIQLHEADRSSVPHHMSYIHHTHTHEAKGRNNTGSVYWCLANGIEVGVRLNQLRPNFALASCRAVVKLGNLPEPQFLQLESG